MATLEGRAGVAPERLGRWAGALYAFLVLACVALVGVGVCVEPDARGHGTHERLGLPPCLTVCTIGYPCPLCGFTTALSNMARGRPMAALAASGFGTLVFLGACALVVWTLVALGARRCPTRVFAVLKSPWCWGGLVAAYFASWAANIAAVMAGWKVMR